MIHAEFGRTIEDYNVFEQIGKGGFGIVFKARCRNTGKDVAIKKISKFALNPKCIERVREEVKIHSTLKHESIVKLYTFYEDENYVYLVLELCSNGNLDQKIKRLGRTFNEKEAEEILGQVVDGFIYLHSRGIMHRDLTPRNILLDAKGKIKIADFGMAAKLKRMDEKHVTVCGTHYYISPEMCNKQSYDLKADVYTFGCLMHTMLVGYPSCERDSKGNCKFPAHLSTHAKDLIDKCLRVNAQERIELFNILRHPFFASYVEGRKPTSCRSDSGVDTSSTNVISTQYTKTPLSAVCEESEGFYSQDCVRNSRSRRPSHSPPVRLQTNSPEELDHIGEAFVNFRKKLSSQNRNGISNNFKHKPQSSRRGMFFEREEAPCINGRNFLEVQKGIDERVPGNYIENPLREHLNHYDHRDLLPSRVRPNVNIHEDHQRYASSDGGIVTLEQGQFCLKQINSIDQQRYEEERYKDRKVRAHSSGCQCTDCLQKNCQKHCQCKSYQEENSCHGHRSRKDNCRKTPTSPSSKYSTKSASSGRSHSVEILKDIAPVCRSPSPILAPPPPPCQPPDAIPIHTPPTQDRHHPMEMQECKINPSSNCNQVKKTLQDLCSSPLSTKRLKANRQHSGNVVLSILNDGEVCVEFLDKKKKIDTVCQISQDGNKIVIYHPKPSLPLLDIPVVIPRNCAYSVYNYDNLPQIYWKKYTFAARFVKLVKKRTSKITYYSDQAKCFLMENSPNADFKALFYTGETLLFSENTLLVTDLTKETKTYDLGSEDLLNNKYFRNYYQHFYEHALKVREHCLMLEDVLTGIEMTSTLPCFPACFGKRPSVSASSERQKNGNEKENISPVSVQSTSSRANNVTRQLGLYESSITSGATFSSRPRRPLTLCQSTNVNNQKNGSSKWEVNGIGELYMDDRIFRLTFLDGSSLESYQSQSSYLIYIDASGKKHTYPENSIPPYLKLKNEQFKTVYAKVRASSTKGQNVCKRPVSTGKSPQLPKYIR